MSDKFSVQLHTTDNGKSVPPSWATGDHGNLQCWYYENEHGEQWVARREKGLLRIAGMDIGWSEIHLNSDQVSAEKERLQKEILLRQIATVPELKSMLETIAKTVAANLDLSIEYPLSKWIFNEGEMYWLVSVLQSAAFEMKWEEEKKGSKG